MLYLCSDLDAPEGPGVQGILRLTASDERSHDAEATVEHHEICHRPFGQNTEAAQTEGARRRCRAQKRGIHERSAKTGDDVPKCTIHRQSASGQRAILEEGCLLTHFDLSSPEARL